MAARAVVGVALATAGVLVLLDLSRLDFASGQLRGDLLILANSLSYSFYLVLSRPVLARYSARTVVSRIFLYGAVPILLVAAPALLRFSPAAVPAISWGGLAAIVVLSSVLPYLWNSWLLASVLAVLVLGEKFAPRTLAAAALIFAGLAVAVAGRAPLRRALP
jgi:drug/metabolite transporter (DMT)-like permease